MKILDTIAAVSTPRGKGGVALIRISGAEALAVASAVFTPMGNKDLSGIQPNRAVYGNIYETSVCGEKICIDDGMATYFKAPRSFTGEDTVEISCHGGVLITSCVLSAVLSAGARQADAGEFTRRAFLNGKLDLTEAEALGSLLEAKNINQLHMARSTMKGILTDRTKALYDSLKAMLGSIYARIDFPDEDLSDMSTEKMIEVIEEILDKTQKLSETYRTGRAVSEGIKTVICGRTNAGKSSVYNRLTGDDSAIVTDVEGTTRDILKETVTLGKTTLRICDTAGLRATDDAVESIGIEKALAEIESAELILAVFDTSKPLSEEDMAFIGKLLTMSAPIIALLNKTDLCSENDTAKTIEKSFKNIVYLSAKSGDGFDALSDKVDSLFIDGSLDLKTDAVVSDARQYASLVRAAEALRNALSALSEGVSLDLCCIDIENAMQALGELEGREVGEDVVSEIFSKFCVGK
ncbi:MAG: tRNA uridine-5-carboxymethylaminomethyl(34) synthesis GTPase MnmE [Clostridia bacterium]|nr:tRNA uridine-5-carboxymethylaminomethyl(34) synthesis GTPase MnmE [Clostridia bacterium]